MKRLIIFLTVLSASSLSFAAGYVANNKIKVNTTNTSTNYMTFGDDSITISTPTVIQGQVTNTAETHGAYGERMSTSAVANVAGGATTVYVNVVSTTISPGIWDCRGTVVTTGPGVAGWTDSTAAISINSGNTTTDHVQGLNTANSTSSTAFGANDRFTLVIPGYEISVSAAQGTIPVYLKVEHTWSIGAPGTRFSSLTCTRIR
jgi:hypothetical protein